MISMRLQTVTTLRPLLLFCTLSSVTVLSGCGDKNEREFMRGCQYSGGTTALCGCIWDELNTNYTHGELDRMNQEYGYVPPRFMENMQNAAQQCRK